MIFKFHKNFDKSYSKLGLKLQKKVDVALERFQINPFDETLSNHGLKGSMLGKRAISVTGDVRIIFEKLDNYIIVHLLYVGTHNQVY